jgi:hypothetical protein
MWASIDLQRESADEDYWVMSREELRDRCITHINLMLQGGIPNGTSTIGPVHFAGAPSTSARIRTPTGLIVGDSDTSQKGASIGLRTDDFWLLASSADAAQFALLQASSSGDAQARHLHTMVAASASCAFGSLLDAVGAKIRANIGTLYDALVQHSSRALCDIAFSLLEASCKRLASSHVAPNGSVRVRFPRRNGSLYRDGATPSICSSLYDLLKLNTVTLAGSPAAQALDKVNDVLKLQLGVADGFDELYKWRNAINHGHIVQASEGHVILLVALVLLLTETPPPDPNGNWARRVKSTIWSAHDDMTKQIEGNNHSWLYACLRAFPKELQRIYSHPSVKPAWVR